MEERRIHPRVSTHLPFRLKILEPPESGRLRREVSHLDPANFERVPFFGGQVAATLNLSSGGLCVEGGFQRQFTQMFHQSKAILLEVELPDGMVPFQALGGAVWARVLEDGTCRVGFEFDAVSEPNLRRVRGHVSRVIVRNARQAGAPQIYERSRQKKILVVDDFENGRFSCVEMLVSLGISRDNIDEAADGVEAMRAMSRGRYDLVISDMSMPAMSGDDMVRQMSRDEALMKIPVILHTGQGGIEVDALRSYQNVAAVFKKPYDAKAMLQSIETTLASAARH